MKKILMLTAAGLMFQAAPALADGHGDHGEKGAKKAEMFKAADTNGDGAISKDEYMARVQTKAAEKFNKKDANGDGSISQEESKAYHDAKRGKMKDKMKEKRESMQEKRMERKEKED